MTAPEATYCEPFNTVLVPTDFSKSAELGLRRALLLPLAPNAKLHVMHVLPSDLPASLRSKAEAEARCRLDQALSGARATAKAASEVQLTSEVLQGEAFVEIVRASRTLNAELIVLGRHGLRPIGDMLIGTTAERVVRNGDVPVLVVNLEASHPYRHPLIAANLDDASHRTVELALRVLSRRVKAVDIVHAFHVPFEGVVTPSSSAREKGDWRRVFEQRAVAALTELLAPHRDFGVGFNTVISQGDPGFVVLAAATRLEADLIAIGTHGRSGIAHALLGSVAEWVITGATCDVLVARPIRHSFATPRAYQHDNGLGRTSGASGV